jgi:tRNA(Ile)-lysidine synthase TilS/MesJ
MSELLEKQKALKRRIETLEITIDNKLKELAKIKKHECEEISKLEIELYILNVYYSHLVRSLKEEEYLKDSKFNLKIRESLLNELSPETRISILCISEGICGI